MALDRLSALPPELRNSIYELVLRTVPKSGHIMLGIVDGAVRRQDGEGRPIPGLLGASKVIRREVSQMYYRFNAHTMYTSIDDIQVASDWLAATIRLCGRLPQRFVFTILDPSWSNFQELLPLVEVAREPGLNPAPLRLMITGRAGARLLSVLGEAVGLGGQAHGAGVTAQQLLQQQFEQWVAQVRQRPYVKQMEEQRMRAAKQRRSTTSHIPVRSG
ncbi:hypothetical protein LTR85_008808 [Meristemomyces frigidus]|nr:hypothetical protein LTR85_008808 [Meristemomyces frigidus]